jgi:hypothetical protein
LQDDLLKIPGVEGAEIDGLQDAPAGLRIRIAEGADQEAVGGAIRRVLSSHGLGTDTMLPGEGEPVTPSAGVSGVEGEQELGAVGVLAPDRDVPSSRSGVEEPDEIPEPGVSAVIDLTDNAPGILAPEILATEEDSEDEASEQLHASVAPGSWEQPDPPSFVEPRFSESPELGDGPESASGIGDSVARIESVAVVEGRSGILVTVTASTGDEISHAASATEGGVEAAVVIAAARLVDPSAPDPTVVEIEDRRVEGVDIVMIVLDMDGRIAAGSAIVEAGRVFSLGRATWAALAL